MRRAWCLIREQPAYRREAFVAGLKRAGYTLREGLPGNADPGDAVVIWNRYGSGDEIARRAESAGALVIVAENGYLGADSRGIQYYALAAGGHNGSGRWPACGPERFAALGVALAPWRETGGHVLVCPNRSFGPRGFAMPDRWAEDAAARLRSITRRAVRIRPHPGNWQVSPPDVPLANDLAGAWCVVIWASSAGVHALAAGVPVIYEAPHWVLEGAASRDIRRIDDPPMPERRPAFERLAWAQWSVEEIASGEPFRRLAAA